MAESSSTTTLFPVTSTLTSTTFATTTTTESWCDTFTVCCTSLEFVYIFAFGGISLVLILVILFTCCCKVRNHFAHGPRSDYRRHRSDVFTVSDFPPDFVFYSPSEVRRLEESYKSGPCSSLPRYDSLARIPSPADAPPPPEWTPPKEEIVVSVTDVSPA